jgi:IclR family acetate operon transcriptional repressor
VLPVSSVHNVLQTMVAAEVLVVDEDLRYFVGPRTVSLALRTVHALDVRSLARRPLQDLAREIGDDVYLGLRMGSRVVYADRILGTQRISLDIRLGESLFLHSTATGKLFAAFDDRLAAGVMGRKLPKLTATTITSAEGLTQEYARIRE